MLTVCGALDASNAASNVPVVVLNVAVYVFDVSIVMGGAAVYVCLPRQSAWLGTSGQPAFTAASLALAWRAASDFPAAVVVVVTFDCDCTGLLLLLDRRKATEDDHTDDHHDDRSIAVGLAALLA